MHYIYNKHKITCVQSMHVFGYKFDSYVYKNRIYYVIIFRVIVEQMCLGILHNIFKLCKVNTYVNMMSHQKPMKCRSFIKNSRWTFLNKHYKYATFEEKIINGQIIEIDNFSWIQLKNNKIKNANVCTKNTEWSNIHVTSSYSNLWWTHCSDMY